MTGHTLTGVALLPGRDVMEHLIRFRQRHEDAIAGPRLGVDANLPHLSVLQCPFTQDVNADTVVRIVARHARNHGTPVMFDRVAYQPAGWVFAHVTHDGWLTRLQDVTLQLVGDHIGSWRDDPDTVDELDPAGRASYVKYGYRYVGDAYLPHVTLGRTPPGVTSLPGTVVNEFRNDVAGTGFEFTRAVFYEAGPFGTLSHVIAQCPI